MGEDADEGTEHGQDAGEAPADASDEAEREAAGADSDPAELRERIAELEDERTELESQLSEARDELEELTERLHRKAADFENYKKRQERRRQEFEAAATESLLERLLDVRDNLQRAVDQESDDVESLREGVKLTLAELDKVLDAEDVAEIDPAPGAAVDPSRHEVMLRVDSEQPADRIADVYQPGYERADKVLRPAQVTVSEGQTADADDGADEPAEERSASDTDGDAEHGPVGEQ